MKAPTDSSPADSGTPITLVVADDSPPFRKAIRSALEWHPRIQLLGMAPDGLEAVELVTKLQPQLVLLDFQMPHLNGLLAARAIRTTFPTVRIIVMSAHHTAELARASREYGADVFVEKARLSDELPGLLGEWFAYERDPGVGK